MLAFLDDQKAIVPLHGHEREEVRRNGLLGHGLSPPDQEVLGAPHLTGFPSARGASRLWSRPVSERMLRRWVRSVRLTSMLWRSRYENGWWHVSRGRARRHRSSATSVAQAAPSSGGSCSWPSPAC